MPPTRVFALLVLMIVQTVSMVRAQREFTAGSRLADSAYVQRSIKEISDSDLCAALDTSDRDMVDIARAAAKNDYVRAFTSWARHWSAPGRPEYISRSSNMLIDTETLMEHDEYRMVVGDTRHEKDSVLARADKILQNKILVWGDSFVEFGPEVDFNREVGRSGKYGFHYWLWARPLNSAYILTGEQRYLQKVDQLFNRWYDQRNRITRSIPEFDPVYYELGLGVRNRVFIEYYRLPFLTRSLKTHERMLKTMLAAGRWLYELEKWEGYRAGNWQIHGAFMLVQIALTFPEFRESKEWLNVGMYRLEEHLANDFFMDGGHSERCPRNYTLATYLAYRNLYYLLKVHNSHPEVADTILRTMGNTIDWWMTMIAPTGELPAINDSHRGMFPASVLQDGAKLFKRPAAFSVMKTLLNVRTGDTQEFPALTSRFMPASGFTVMRSDWTRNALYMNINHGPAAPTHTHADLMSFEVYAYGQALAVDAGIGMTYDDSLYVPWYQSSRAHNMVVLNDRNMRRENTTGENVRWVVLKSAEYLAGDQRGYEAEGLRHRRHILYMKSRYWFIVDEMRSTETGDTLSWYFHSPTPLQPLGRGYSSTTGPGISILPAIPLERRKGSGRAASTSVTQPGATEEINWISFDQLTQAGTIQRFPVLLQPYRTAAPVVRVSEAAPGSYVIVDGESTDQIIVPSGQGLIGEVLTDASMVVLSQGGPGGNTFELIDGTFLQIGEKTVFRSPTRTSVEGEWSP